MENMDVPIFPAVDVELQQAKREAARLRKRNQRAREKAKADVKAGKSQAAAKKFVSNSEWWSKNLSTLTAEQREGLQAREDEVGGLLVMIDSFMAYPPEDAEDKEILAKLIQDVKKDAKKHGTCASGLMGIPNLSQRHEELHYENQADRDAVQFGILTALPSQLRIDFMRRFVPVPPPKCATYACPNPQGTAEPWYCDSCSAERTRRSNAHHSHIFQAKDVIYGVSANANAAWFRNLEGLS